MSDKETCWRCDSPATYVLDTRLPTPGFVPFGATRPTGSGIRIVASSCQDHEDGLLDATCDRAGHAAGRRLVLPDCDDPFHDGAPGEAYDAGSSGGLSVTGFRCPTCGFQTVTKSTPRDDETYRAALAILDALHAAEA